MKIIVDFVRAEQHWDPDDGVQTNFLVFDFGGKRHRIPCEEADIINAVRESKGKQNTVVEIEREPDGLEQHAAALGRVEDYTEPYESTEQQGQIEDVTPEPIEFDHDVAHSLFVNIAEVTEEIPDREEAQQPKSLSAEAQRKQDITKMLASRPRSRDKQTKEKLDRLRKAAAAPLQPHVEVDEAGNPIMRSKAVPRTISIAQAAVEKTVDGVRDLGDLVSDDDAFGQG